MALPLLHKTLHIKSAAVGGVSFTNKEAKLNSVSLNIVIGIVTGLLTASCLLIIKSLFLNSFLPWYRHIMFKGLDLRGSWHSADRSQKILLELNQSCDKLSGKATVHLSKDDFNESLRDELHIDDIRTFDVQGEASERFVSIRLKHTDRTRIGLVTYLLQVDGDGTRLSGQGCWYSPLASKISSGNQVFYRDEARAIRIAQQRRDSKIEELHEVDNEES